MVEFRLDRNQPAPVRFVGGYEAFADYVSARESSPEALRDDLAVLMAFLLQHPELLDDLTLVHSAGIFLGNTIAALHANSQWKVVGDEPTVGPRGFEFPVHRAVRGLIEQPDLHDGFYQAATNWTDSSSSRD